MARPGLFIPGVASAGRSGLWVGIRSSEPLNTSWAKPQRCSHARRERLREFLLGFRVHRRGKERMHGRRPVDEQERVVAPAVVPRSARSSTHIGKHTGYVVAVLLVLRP